VRKVRLSPLWRKLDGEANLPGMQENISSGTMSYRMEAAENSEEFLTEWNRQPGLTS